jgi:hypothetical protein
MATDRVPSPAGTQDNWCFCTKCYALFFHGYPTYNGVCPAGEQHSSTGGYGSWNLALQVASSNPPSQGGDGGVPSPAGTQDNWCFCTKCYALFFHGYPTYNGVCPVGQQHSPLQSDSPTGAYSSWNMALQVASTNTPQPFTATVGLPPNELSMSIIIASAGNNFPPNTSYAVGIFKSGDPMFIGNLESDTSGTITETVIGYQCPGDQPAMEIVNVGLYHPGNPPAPLLAGPVKTDQPVCIY